ncbi:hypothetical protein BD413DRAFT_487097 [Trametes elegans]|nr:hypothetical protein BD413DRAFT_487097 [Trametes elegans]
MSLKAELETWAAALQAYDSEDFEKSLELFSQIADSSKILTNIGLIYATLGEHEAAVEQFSAATELDQYLAVAYFQCGVSNFLLARYDAAYNDFSNALLYLRGNPFINYEQLGLKFKLFSAEVLFNRGLTQIYMGNQQEGLADMEDARREKATEEHGVIDDAIQDRGEGYTVFSIPVGVLYRPAQKKLDNSKARDFLGKARLVAAESANDLYTEFTGVARMKQGITPTGIFLDDGPNSNPALTRAATVAATLPSTSLSLPSLLRVASTALMRAKTTITVPSDARDRIRAGGAGAGTPPPAPPKSSPMSPSGPSLARSATSGGMGRSGGAPVPLGLNGPTRGLSIRKGGSPTNPAGRMTDFYDDYLEGYTGGAGGAAEPPLPEPVPEARVANWAKGVGRGGRPSAPPSSYAPSTGTGPGGSMRRKLTRRGTTGRAGGGGGSRSGGSFYGGYEEEEEGYVSGEYEDVFEMVKIRVKLYYREDVRGMALLPETPYEDFMEMVQRKFGVVPGALGMKFKDEDGGKVTLRDEMDYELAIETARHNAKGRPEGRLEIWCLDE